MTTDPIILPHGGYKDLLCYRKSVVVFLGTVWYCKRFLRHPDRTIDQMVQGARSGKQNIVEGNENSGTSKEMEIRLLSVARGSLEELQEDYKDQLRIQGIEPWPENDERTLELRRFSHHRNDWAPYKELYQSWQQEKLCNLSICLIHQTCELLDKLLIHLVEEFEKHGELRNRMTAVRHETKGAEWEDSLYHHLAAAGSLKDLLKRYNDILEKARKVRWAIARRRGWEE